MISRRATLAGLGATVGLRPARVFAAARPRVGIASLDRANNRMAIDELIRKGWIPGETIDILEAEEGPTIASLDALVARGIDVLIAPGPVRIQHALTKPGLPIVGIDLESDPVEAGFVKSLARPGGLVTGFWLDLPLLAAKLIELLHELSPHAERIAVVWDGRGGRSQFEATIAAAEKAKMKTFPLAVGDEEHMNVKVKNDLEADAHAVVILGSPPIFLRRMSLMAAINERRLPSVTSLPDVARAGSALGYGPNLITLWRRAAEYVDRILRGQSPGDLPVERPAKFELVINRRTADAIGLPVSPLLLARADEVIE